MQDKSVDSAFNLFPIENKDLYRLVMMNTLVASAAFTSFHIVTSTMSKDDAEGWKLKLMSSWEKSMNASIQDKIKVLNDLSNSGKIENADLLPSPEEFQQEFNDILKEVKQMAAKALWPGKF